MDLYNINTYGNDMNLAVKMKRIKMIKDDLNNSTFASLDQITSADISELPNVFDSINNYIKDINMSNEQFISIISYMRSLFKTLTDAELYSPECADKVKEIKNTLQSISGKYVNDDNTNNVYTATLGLLNTYWYRCMGSSFTDDKIYSPYDSKRLCESLSVVVLSEDAIQHTSDGPIIICPSEEDGYAIGSVVTVGEDKNEYIKSIYNTKDQLSKITKFNNLSKYLDETPVIDVNVYKNFINALNYCKDDIKLFPGAINDLKYTLDNCRDRLKEINSDDNTYRDRLINVLDFNINELDQLLIQVREDNSMIESNALIDLGLSSMYRLVESFGDVDITEDNIDEFIQFLNEDVAEDKAKIMNTMNDVAISKERRISFLKKRKMDRTRKDAKWIDDHDKRNLQDDEIDDLKHAQKLQRMTNWHNRKERLKDKIFGNRSGNTGEETEGVVEKIPGATVNTAGKVISTGGKVLGKAFNMVKNIDMRKLREVTLTDDIADNVMTGIKRALQALAIGGAGILLHINPILTGGLFIIGKYAKDKKFPNERKLERINKLKTEIENTEQKLQNADLSDKERAKLNRSMNKFKTAADRIAASIPKYEKQKEKYNYQRGG